MLFSSYVFIACFLPATATGFFVLARLCGRLAAASWLAAASFFFYGWWNPSSVPLLAASIGFNYGLARLIVLAGRAPRVQTALLVGGVAADLGALVYFKYAATLLGSLHVSMTDPVLPLGISFFTFTQIAFLIDVQGDPEADAGFLDYLLFVSFFPHLIAGPLLHHREMMPQFAAAPTFRLSAENVSVGLAIFAIGLAKKTLLADQIAPFATAGFAAPAHIGVLAAWQAALAYSLQLYFDFSGYSDMAIGIARLFNVRFPANFNSPYKAQSIIDYWQRWHMTLTRYLTLYLYNPIALRIARARAAKRLPTGRKAGIGGFAATVLCPTFATMGFAGVWHGSGLTFLVFGLLHATYLSANHAWRLFRPDRCKPRPGAARACRRILLTYLCVLVGAVVFRADTLSSARDMLAGMAGLHGTGLTAAEPDGALRTARGWALILLLGAIAFGAPNTQEIMRDHTPILGALAARAGGRAWQPSLGWAVAFGCLGALGLLAIGGSGEFLYFQF